VNNLTTLKVENIIFCVFFKLKKNSKRSWRLL